MSNKYPPEPLNTHPGSPAGDSRQNQATGEGRPACRAVFLDAGETLLSPHPSFHELFSDVLAENGVRMAAPDVEAAFKRIAPSFIEVMDKLGVTNWSTSRAASERFWSAVYATAFEQMRIFDPGGKLSRALYERFTRYESYRLFPDSLPALAGLRRSGLTLGLISNFEEWLEGMLIEMEVAHLFDLMVISGKEGVEKPDPAIFKLAIDRSGLDPRHCVYVGDHPRIDMQAAEAVGMKGILIDRRDRYPEFEGPRIRSLDELYLQLPV